MGTFLVVAVGFLALSALLFLAAPLRLRLSFSDRKKSLALSWLVIDLEGNLKEKVFKLNLLDRTIVRRKFTKSEKEVEEAKEKRPGVRGEVEKVKKKSKLRLLDLWSKKELVLRVIRVAFRFLVDLLRAIRWDELSLEVDVATPDPALTGTLYGQLCAAEYSLHRFFPSARIEVRPDFVNQLPRGSGETAFSIRPVNLVAPASKMFLALPKIQIVKALIELKRR